MRSFDLRLLLLAGLAAYAMPVMVLAAPPDSDAPPQMEKLDEGEPPAVTIRKPESNSKIEEKRAPGGKVTEVKVTTGGSTYYLKPNDPAGSALPGDAQSSHNRGAQWEVQQFDLGQRAKKQKMEEAARQAPEPPAVPAKPRGK